MTYTEPLGNEVDFELTEYIVLLGNEVDFELIDEITRRRNTLLLGGGL